jgi:alpha-glucosidase (family GH31 glycosyl hydrolase)
MYVRWLQYGTFNPIFRVHGDFRVPVEPYLYSDSAQKILMRFINLRYQLLPYNYTLAWQNSVSGKPLTRPLFFEEPENDTIASIADTYLWGPNLLVAPILEKGQTSRKLYLPEGNWFNFFDDTKYLGGQWIEKNVDFESIPVFARGGSFIPMIEPIRNTEEYSSENLTIHFWFDDELEQAEFTMYEDDGRTKDSYQKGLYELLQFNAENYKDMLILKFDREKHDYQGMPQSRQINLIIHNYQQIPEKVMVNDIVIAPSKIKYDHEAKQLSINFRWVADDMHIQIRK